MSPPALPELADYQLAFVDNVRRIVEQNHYRRRPRIRILDTGCDPTGRQLAHLARLTRGEVVGINYASDFPSPEAVAAAGSNVTLANMDGTALGFPDASFDLVISANVMEHVADPERYLRECSRVLRPGGLAYIETEPVWSGPRGHHIHEDSVAYNCPDETAYRNDGSVIPDWAHLRMDEEALRAVLAQKLRPETCGYILHYLYHTTNLNKRPWRDIRGAMERSFAEVSIRTTRAPEPWTGAPPEGDEDGAVAGFSAVARRTKPNPFARAVARRVIWRLRRVGL